MSFVANVEEQALSLTARERGELITKLLRSLPAFPSDSDVGLAEAKRRREEMRKHPEIGISLDELDRRMKERYP
ncbi:MAG: addiction module protein [Acidobacteria bacterium]|nr:addiction module protein [Acidobacteriota bacterium]MCW5949158.1 addiction module protein [Pyrinomonadaceae bacterium]